jgi:sec-independent protein translocase protein TatB
MFDIGLSELIVIGVVALIAIGPKELPGALRAMGQMVRRLKSLAGDARSQFDEAMREAEVADLKASVDGMRESVSKATSVLSDPASAIKAELSSAVETSDYVVQDYVVDVGAPLPPPTAQDVLEMTTPMASPQAAAALPAPLPKKAAAVQAKATENAPSQATKDEPKAKRARKPKAQESSL